MEYEKILENLCFYDKKNPDCIYTEKEIQEYKKNPCYCDNCFYGRTKIAEKILQLISQLK